MAYGSTLHWGFHGAGPAAGADVHFAQAQLIAYFTGIKILSFVNGVTAPADHHIWLLTNVQSAGVAQNGEHQAGQVNAAVGVQTMVPVGLSDLAVDKQNVAQNGKQIGLNRVDQSTVYKSFFRRID